ncbi:hypothetical protein SARC_11376 [Sphaeroforma arctica JP610]|uniref:Uncharacterized protein n=1 Tax=Sphaeroforma arctica JP610 TaxID=667725 RepID=A0A0L0FH65_9EUKA|nr:hypothetical protein SARC_11376 [Sphaeroforma arctica JP610]KNC76114.1 hypothetical protein SARC_11376 [Sphaeroforma arctica JP610]|eukprot:XP_014150016.1 hypothetical protein SARC_11376 [Sphaeroforma arctica JP610]
MSAAFQNRFQTPHKPPAWGNVLALYATLGLLCMVHNILSLNIFNRALSDVEGPAILITWLALAVSSIYYKNYAQDWANCVVVGWLDIIGLKMTISIINSHAFSGCTAIALLHMAVLTPVMLHDNVPELQTKVCIARVSFKCIN